MAPQSAIFVFSFLNLFILCNSQSFNRTLNITYRVGIPNIEVQTFLSAVNTSGFYNTTAFRVDFDSLEVFLSSNVDAYPSNLNEILKLNVSAIISEFSQDLAVLSNFAKIPYYVISNPDEYAVSPYMLSISIGEYALGLVIGKLLTQFGISGLTIIKDDSPRFEVILPRLPFSPVKIISLTVQNDVIVDSLISAAMSQSNNYCYLVVMEDSSLFTMLDYIMSRAMYLGQVRSNKLWIIHSVYYNLTSLSNYTSTGASIYTTSIPSTNKSQLLQYTAQDAYQHWTSMFGVSLNYTDLRSKVITGVTGNVQFDSNGYRTKFVFDIMKLSPTGATKAGSANYQYGDVTLDLSQDVTSLTNKLVRVAYYIASPYMSGTPPNDTYGMGIDILGAMMSLSSFTVRFVPLTRRTKNTIEDDLVDMLVRDEADFSIIPMENTANRSKLVEFSVDIMNTAIDILAVKPRVTLSFLWLLQPYTFNVWIGIGSTLFFLSFIFWAMDKISPNKVEGFQGYSFSHSCLIVFSSPFMAKVKTEPMKPSARLFAILLWFGSLMLMATYIANMVAYCVKPDPSIRFTNFTTLLTEAQSKNYSFLFMKNYSATNMKILRNPYAFILYNISNNSTMFVENYDDVLDRMRANTSSVFIGDSLFIRNALYMDCSFTSVAIQAEKYGVAIAINKNFKPKDTLKKVIQSMVISGNFLEQERVWYDSGPCAQTDSAYQRITVRPLNLPILAGLFVSIGGAIVLACIIGFFEWFRKKIILCWKFRNVESLEFGKVYNAKIDSVGQDGLWARINNRPRRYFLHNCHLSNDPLKVYTAEDLHLHVGDIIQVKYFGKDPTGGAKRFMRYESDA